MGQARNEWKETIIDACVCNHLSWDENDPRKTLSNLIAWECKIALDPQVSKEAAELVARGVAARETMTAEQFHKQWRSGGQLTDHITAAAACVFAEAYANYRAGNIIGGENPQPAHTENGLSK